MRQPSLTLRPFLPLPKQSDESARFNLLLRYRLNLITSTRAARIKTKPIKLKRLYSTGSQSNSTCFQPIKKQLKINKSKCLKSLCVVWPL